MPQDQDPFSSASLQDPSEYSARFNVLEETELGRGAIGHRHVPPTYSLPSGVHSKFGGHGDDLPGQELYQCYAIEGTTGGGHLYPKWDPAAHGAPVMRTLLANPPYGATPYVDGWSILARNNNVVHAAKLDVNINYSTGNPLADGVAALDICGWVEATNGNDGTGTPDISPIELGPIFGIALLIDTDWYVVPSSIATYTGNIWCTSLHTRLRVTASLLRSLVPGGTLLREAALVVCMRKPVVLPLPAGVQAPGVKLGNWGISIDPFISEEVT